LWERSVRLVSHSGRNPGVPAVHPLLLLAIEHGTMRKGSPVRALAAGTTAETLASFTSESNATLGTYGVVLEVLRIRNCIRNARNVALADGQRLNFYRCRVGVHGVWWGMDDAIIKDGRRVIIATTVAGASVVSRLQA
jgi:hypothetical protein